MAPDDVLQLLDALEGAGIVVWVDGGWGVDALAGRTTRPHSDLDLAIDRQDVPEARRILEERGFRHDRDAEPGLPARLVMHDDAGRQVDLHPLKFDDDGDGWQQLSGAEDDWGRYPATGLAAFGSIGGRTVRCLSAELQIRFHQGYEPTAKDEHDLRLLAQLTSRGAVSDELIERFAGWVRQRDDVIGAALVGSRARGAARPGSDIDLMIVSTSPDAYVTSPEWVHDFGRVESVAIEEWGAVTSLRVRYDGGPEVELGFAAPAWAATDPVEAGTARVLGEGFRILFDREGLLQRLADRVGR